MAVPPSLRTFRRSASVLGWPAQGLRRSVKQREPRELTPRSLHPKVGSLGYLPYGIGSVFPLVCGVGFEPTTFRLRVERSTTERSAIARTRALPAAPSAFDRQNTTRVLAFTLAGFAGSSGLGELHPPSLYLSVALGFQPSDCASARTEARPPLRSPLLVRWMWPAPTVPRGVLRPVLLL